VGIEEARGAGRALIRRCGVTAARHVFVEGFAARLGLEIAVAPLDGAIGQLVVRPGQAARILLSDRLTDPSERRFTIAHELGHYVLSHPSPSGAALCGALASGREAASERDLEAEANAFASEVLMPEAIVRPMCEVDIASLEPAIEIAHRFGMSLPVGATRFVELSRLRCAAVLSKDGVVCSAAFSRTFGGVIMPGSRVDARSVAGGYFETGRLRSGIQPVPAAAWIPSLEDGAILEHSLESPARDSVLTMLWLPDLDSAPRATPPQPSK
jgi:hypothetical protein